MEKIKIFNSVILGALLVFLCWLTIESAITVRNVREEITRGGRMYFPEKKEDSPLFASLLNLQQTTKNASELTERVNKFVDIDRLKNLDNAVNTQIYSTQQLTNNYSQIASSIVQTNEKQIQPLVAEVREKAGVSFDKINTEIEALQGLTNESTHQLKQNGDQLAALLEKGNTLVASSEKELLETLSNINRTTNGIRVIVEDPALADLIRNSDKTVANVEVTTKNFADLSDYLILPLTHPIPAHGIGKLTKPLIKIGKIATGLGNVLYLIQRLNY